jgi:low temperature requirement protein LtrA
MPRYCRAAGRPLTLDGVSSPSTGTAEGFKRWFWRPPRAHGEIIAHRTVSFLELLYDLVYVAVIAQAAHHLAEHITPRGIAEFAVVFAMIWIAWANGSLYLELHGREDGRTRTIVFVQMGILVLLAVFTARAGDESGRPFALVYAAFLAFVTWLWFTVRRQDRVDRPEFLSATGRYLAAMAASLVAILVSAFLAPEPRLVIWAAFAIGWVIFMISQGRLPVGLQGALTPTDSLVERFGLFTIIVLGEVVFGVVNGLSTAEQDVKTVATGMIALVVGFGLWWIYFDILGRRFPRDDGPAIANWLLSHLPITMSIAAGGAATVSLIANAHEPSTPEWTAWLLTGAVAVGLIAEIVTASTLVDAQRLAVVYRPLTYAMAVGAVAALLVGWLRPAPWLLALLVVAILSALWIYAVIRFLRVDAWGSTG